MARYTRFQGEFLSKANVAWKVEIWQTDGSHQVEGLDFPADEPVVIEWDTKAKEEVICGSSCTVKLVSPSDRKYIGLYTVTPGSVGVCIWRKAVNASSYMLYWIGTLDPEQYEEPYERAWGYEVMLTFQDFGVWSRLKYNLDGMQKMSDILADALGRAGLVSSTETTSRVNFSSLVSSYHINETSGSSGDLENIDEGGYIGDSNRPSGNTNPSPREPLESDTGDQRPIYHWGDTSPSTPSTPSTGAVLATLETLAVQSTAFYEEGEDEGATLEEVITAMLQPLGMKIVQRNGKIWVYDINSLVLLSDGPSGSISGDDLGLMKPIHWTSDSQTLGTDRVYHRVKLTFGPNAGGTIIKPEVKVENVDELWTNVGEIYTSAVPWGNTFYSNYRKKNGGPYDPSDLQFTLFYNIGYNTGYGKGFSYVRNGYFKIVSLLGGSDADGILGKAVIGHAAMSGSVTGVGFYAETASQSTVQFRTERVYIPPIRRVNGAGRRWLLRLQMEMLIDVRYNPFTEAGDYNEKDNYNDIAKERYNYVFVPCNVRLYDSKYGGTCKYHYNNRIVAMRANYDDGGLIYMGDSMGSWLNGKEADSAADAGCWLSWYANDEESRDRSMGIGGWKKNRHQIGARIGKLAADLMDTPEGQYMQYPPDGGWLEITVWNGLVTHDQAWGIPVEYFDDIFTDSWNNGSAIRWMLYKSPVVDVVNGGTNYDTYDADDVITEGIATVGAEEDLEIDLTLGTMGKDTPSARGQIYRVATGLPLRNLTRAGDTNTPEKLLLRTLCAQYGSRQTTLSGEAEIKADSPHLWADANRTGKKMLMLGEAQNLIEDVTDVVLCDVSPDSAASSDIPATVWFTVTSNFSHVSAVGGMPSRVRIVMPLEIELAADTGYAISNVVVRMDGEVVDGAWDSETNTVLVEAVVGDIEIVADAEWAMPYDAVVECIKATGSQYVTFPVSAAAGDSFGVVLDFVNKTTATGKNLLKDQRSSSYQYNMRTYGHNDETLRTQFSTTVGTKSQVDGVGGAINVYDNTRTEIELSTTKKRTGDTEVAISRPLTNSISSLTLLSSGYTADIYGMRVYKNGADILDLIPVRVNGEGKLFDRVSMEIKGTYTGTFEVGEDSESEE